MEKLFFAKVILIAACLPLIAGCIVERQPGAAVVAPPAQVEIVPESPGPAYVWLKGRYEWRDGNWLWVSGRWMIAPRPHAIWVAGHWEHRPHGFVWIGGHWR